MSGWLLLFEVGGKILAVAGWLCGAPVWLCLAGIFIPDFVLLYQMFAPSAQSLCPVVTHFQTVEREVWLTIDDGPDPVDTPRILAALSQRGAKATFFLIGKRVEMFPDLARQIVAAGHEIGHHTYSHPTRTFWLAGAARVARELDHALTAFHAVGVTPRWFRPPVGIKNFFLAEALKRRGLTCIGWSLRSFDSVSRDPAEVASRIRTRVQPGALLLLHEGERLARNVRGAAIEQVLAELAGAGYRCVLPSPASLRERRGNTA